MKINKQARRDAKTLFRACQANGLLAGDLVRSTVEELLQRKPRGYFAILSHFQRLVKLEQDRRAARIESAMALVPEQRAKIQEHLTARYGEGLTFSFETTPALLGGMRIRVGSDVYDGSVQGRLQELEESFKAA